MPWVGGGAEWAPRGGRTGLGEENIGGGGMGPISVTPMGGSGRSGMDCWPPPEEVDSVEAVGGC